MGLKAWWSRSPAPGNLGDVLTPIILRGFGFEVEWAPHRNADLLCIGSILGYSRPRHTVWGSGIMWSHDEPHPAAEYLAVRGPLSRDAILRVGGGCPEVYGDPALLLPLVHSPPVEVHREFGIVPHYVDEKYIGAQYASVISPLSNNPLAVVDRIRACEVIFSSSLHGIIVAHAYGIPAAWVRFGDRLDGDDVKFRDYGQAVGVELEPAPTIARAEPVLPRFDDGPLLKALGGVR